MNGWIILVIHDGPMRVDAYGNIAGEPFASRPDAERAASAIPRRGAGYSVYVTQIGSLR